jgi:hypothetical protein
MKAKATFVALILWVVRLLVCLNLMASRAQAQGGVPLWTNRYHGPTNSYSEGKAVAVDGSGNVFVTGYLGVVVSNLVVGDHVDSDYVTIKYSNAGVPLWTNRFGGPGNGWDEPCCIAVDSNGDVIVTGISDHSGYNSSHTNFDYATIKYSNAGVPLWTNRYDGPTNGFDGPRAVAVDASGNVFVTGDSVGVGTGYSDYATIKYSGAGVPLWTNRYNGPANATDTVSAMALDSSGNVFVTGGSSRGVTWEDYATIKYSNAGIPLWTNYYDGAAPGNDEARAIAVDSSANVFVTGVSDRFFDPENIPQPPFDCATIKYSNAGVLLWENRFNVPTYDLASPSALAVASNGNVSVTGGVQKTPTSSEGGSATWAYSSSGVPLWTNLFHGPGAAIAVDSSGNALVAGTSYHTNDYSDFAIIAYSGAGVRLWTNLYHGLGDYWDGANAVAVDGSGNVFVTGWAQTSSNSTTGDFVTIKYSSVSPAAPSLTIARTPTNTVLISWPSPSTGFVLQQNTNRLGSVNWSNVTGTIQDNGTNRYIIVNPPAGNRFYRLVKP